MMGVSIKSGHALPTHTIRNALCRPWEHRPSTSLSLPEQKHDIHSLTPRLDAALMEERGARNLQDFYHASLHRRDDNADHVVAARGAVQLCSCVQNSSALPVRFFGLRTSKSNDTAPTLSFVIRSHPHNAASTMTRPQGSGHRGRLMKCLTRLNRRGISPYGTWPR